MSPYRRYPFGALVGECGTDAPEEVDAFLLGAYPSAIHVRWVPPRGSGFQPIAALAVADEPEVFWDGDDADARVEQWREQHFDAAWGEVTAARLNGPSGIWLQANIVKPLRDVGAESQFATDCLTTYRLSVGAASRIADTYQPFARATPQLESADLAPHPSETRIVQEALSTQTDRLMSQLIAARPTVLVSLGNAASRVVAALAGLSGSGKLAADGYAKPREVKIGGTSCTWIAAVHPATPAAWQARHQAWLASGGFSGIFR